jgi:hypothetical protein
MTPIAHTSHWLADLLYVVPVLVAVGLLGMQAVRDRRRRRESPPAETPPAGEA